MGRSNLLPIGTGFNARWKQLYAAAVLELDDAKLPGRIAQARAAMRAKAADSLASSSDEERRTLNDALRILQVLEGMITKRNRAA
jgi:ornithine cyclodeaminase/alanine dehydrogenase-like protein (mu-crystallin family)